MSNNKIIHYMVKNQFEHSVNTQIKSTCWLLAILNLVKNTVFIVRSLFLRVLIHKSIRQIKFPVPELLHK